MIKGGEFENRLMREIQKLCGVASSRTTPYRPEGNGQVERFNRTLLNLLRTLPGDKKRQWHLSLHKLVHAYNCTKHEATGYSPFFLLFGRSPRLPVDIIFDLHAEDDERPAEDRPTSQYVQEFKDSLQEAYKKAAESARKEMGHHTDLFHRKSRAMTLHPGDRVLVRNLTERGGPGKLRSYW
jgi:transposase InsO family protein